MRIGLAVALAIGLAARANAQCAMHAPSELDPGEPVLLEGLGTLHHAVTAKPAAQRWFDQGLRLVYAFNHDEAVRSFREGARLDPSCAMCFWGVALALGPNINMPIDPAREKLAAEAVAQAQALSSQVSAPERGYIAAIATRYGPAEGSRADRDSAYAAAMRTLARANPRDPDAQTLFAESLMDLRPWNLWTHDGKPQPGTLEALAALRSVLKRHPDHPGANHYLIHVLEGSPHPEQALDAAQRLPRLMPGAGHIVHMPSHIYLRLGRYAEATAANEAAIAADKAYLAKAHVDGAYAQMYVAHNFQFLWLTAAMEGRSAESISAARELVARFPVPVAAEMAKQMPGFDALLAPEYFALVRFSKWEALAAEPEPASALPHLHAWWQFGRALALAHLGKPEAAAAAQRAFDAYVVALPPDLMLGPANAVRAVAEVGQAVIAGELAGARGDVEGAVAHLERAVVFEDALNYDEPPPWPLPARERLGSELLQAHRFAEAERAFRGDLARHPENGWALHGLAQALRAQHSKEAPAVERRFRKAWARADVALPR